MTKLSMKTRITIITGLIELMQCDGYDDLSFILTEQEYNVKNRVTYDFFNPRLICYRGDYAENCKKCKKNCWQELTRRAIELLEKHDSLILEVSIKEASETGLYNFIVDTEYV